MAKEKSSNFTQRTGKVGGEIFSRLRDGYTGVRKENSVPTILNEGQKENVSGFTELARWALYLKGVFQVSFPPDSAGVKWSNRFTGINKKAKVAITTTKINPDRPVDPKKKSTDEFTTTIDWSLIVMAQGPLVVPSATVSVQNMTLEEIVEEKHAMTRRNSAARDGEAPEVKANEGEMYKLMIEQESNYYEGAYCSMDDRVYAIVFCPDDGFALLKELRERGESGSTSVSLPSTTPAEKLHVYFFATTANGKTTSNSVHVTVGS